MPELTEELEGMGKVADMIDNDSDPAVTGETDADDPIVTTHVVALVDIEIDAVGNYWHKGFDGENAPAIASVEKNKVYPVSYTSINDVEPEQGEDRVEVVVYDEIDNDDWEWDGLQYLDADEWEYARASQIDGESALNDDGEEGDSQADETGKETASEQADRLVSTSPMSPEEALREFQAYVSNVDRVNRRLIDAQQAVYLQESVVKGEKDELKRRQERVEAITSELSQVCAAAHDPKRYPLFDKGGKSDLPMDEPSQGCEMSDHDFEQAYEPDSETVVIDSQDESWRAV